MSETEKDIIIFTFENLNLLSLALLTKKTNNPTRTRTTTTTTTANKQGLRADCNIYKGGSGTDNDGGHSVVESHD